MRFPDHPLDFSILLPFFERKYADIFLSLLSSKNKIQSFLVFRLLLQKVKVLVYRDHLFENESNHFQLTFSTVLEHLQVNNNSVLVWNLNVCSLNEQNYSTALWRELVKVLPVILEVLSFKDLFSLCGLMRDVLNASLESSHDQMDARSAILSILKNEFIHESKLFQTAFVASLWKPESILDNKRTFETMNEDLHLPWELLSRLYSVRKKWTKFAESTPKSSDGMNDLWLNLKEISDILNKALISNTVMEQKLQVRSIQNLLKLLNCLPLGYLLPNNQLRCIIGLSVLLLLTSTGLKHVEAQPLAKEICSTLVSILRGVRSVWLFDFVKSGPFLNAVTNSLETIIDQDDCCSHDWIKIFLDGLIGLSVMNGEYVSEMDDFVTELSSDLKNKKFSALIMCVVMQKITQQIKRPYMHEDHRADCYKLFSIACSSIIKSTKRNVVKQENDFSLLFVRCYSEIIDIYILSTCEIDEDEKKKCLDLLPKLLAFSLDKINDSEDESATETCLRFISKICLHKEELTKFIQKDFLEMSWTATIFHLEKKSQKIKAHFLSSNPSLISKQFSTTNLDNEKHNHICPSLSAIDPKSGSNCDLNIAEKMEDSLFDFPDEVYLSETEMNALKSLLVASSEQEINLIFQKLDDEKKYSNVANVDVFSFQMGLQIKKHIIKCAQEKSKEATLAEAVQNCLSNLHVLVSQACDSYICKYMIAIPSLRFASFALQMGKVLDGHTVMQTLHFCAPLKLEIQFNNYLTVIKTFNAIWGIVYTLLNQQTAHVLSSRPAFMFFVSLLLKGLVSIGSQSALSSCEKNIYQQMQGCVQNMERLLFVISKQKYEFEKLVPYLVADYVDAVQHVTLEPYIKEHLVLGINGLLTICSEESLKMLAVNVNHSCREVYTNLVKTFKQYRNYGRS